MPTAARLQSGIPSARAARGCSCISRIAARAAVWPRCVSAAAWARPWCWSNLDLSMAELPPEDGAWIPTPEFIRTTNIAWLMERAGVDSYEALHAWSVQNREAFWTFTVERLGIQ